MDFLIGIHMSCINLVCRGKGMRSNLKDDKGYYKNTEHDWVACKRRILCYIRTYLSISFHYYLSHGFTRSKNM